MCLRVRAMSILTVFSGTWLKGLLASQRPIESITNHQVATRLTRHTSLRYKSGHVGRVSRCRCMPTKKRANGNCEQRNVAPPNPSVSRDLCSLLPPSLLPSTPSFGHSSSERSSHILGQARRSLLVFNQARKQRDLMLGSPASLRSIFSQSVASSGQEIFQSVRWAQGIRTRAGTLLA